MQYGAQRDGVDCKVVDLVAVSDDEAKFFGVGGTLKDLPDFEAKMKESGAQLGDVLPLAITLYKSRGDSEQPSRQR